MSEKFVEHLTNLAVKLIDSDKQWRESLIAERVAMGISQKAMGERMGVSHERIALIESPSYDPKLSEMRAYALALELDVSHSLNFW